MTCSFVRRAGTFKIMANITSCTMPTKGTGVVVVVAAAVAVVGVGVAVFNGSDVISSGVGSVVGAMVWLLCGTEMPMTALAVKWVLFVAA